MRKPQFLTIALVFALLFAVGTDIALAQRGGGQRGGGRAPTPLDEATILEDFDKIVETIWTDEEEDAWKDIDDDAVEEKQAFITAFWEGRDPTPGTEDNEFRDQWMARASFANGSFRGEGKAGYETDRGKFYMIYGPEVIVAQENKEVAGRAVGQNAEQQRSGTTTNIVWTLDPSRNPFLEGKEEVAFANYNRTYTKMTGGIDYSEEAFLAGQSIRNYFEQRRANPSSTFAPTGGGAPAPGAAATAAVPPTPDVLAMQQLMQSGTTMQDLVLRQETGFIPAQGGNAFAMFNFEIDKAGLTFDAGSARLLAFGVVLEKDETAPNGEKFVREVKIPFDVSEDEGNAEQTEVHSFGMTFAPGAFRLAWGVMDQASERIATASVEFEAPNYAGGPLEIPSVIVSNGLEQQTDAHDINTIYRGTRVGNLRLNTDLDAAFGRNDEILVLYFVKGLAADPATQAVSFEVNHRILLADTDDSIARLPAQTLPSPGVQQPIPLAQVSQLEAGQSYRIEIHIKDLVNGTELTHLVPFSVRGG